MDLPEIYNTLDWIGDVLMGSSAVIGVLTLGFMYVKMTRLAYSFLPDFEERYQLDKISYGLSAKDIESDKMIILNHLARYYVRPYWLPIRRQATERALKHYEMIRDPYFLACQRLLDKKYTHETSEQNGEESLHIKTEDLVKFLILDRCLTFFCFVGVLTVITFIFWKFGIPMLKRHYDYLHWFG
jgi:hypothetical protein